MKILHSLRGEFAKISNRWMYLSTPIRLRTIRSSVWHYKTKKIVGIRYYVNATPPSGKYCQISFLVTLSFVCIMVLKLINYKPQYNILYLNSILNLVFKLKYYNPFPWPYKHAFSGERLKSPRALLLIVHTITSN